MPSSSQPADQVHPSVHQSARTPGVVALADGVELDALVAHEHHAVDPARDLVAGGAGRVHVGGAVGLPLEVEPEGHPVTYRPPVRVVHGGGIVEPERERLAAERDVVERRLDVVVGPQALGADLERRRPGGRDVVVDHRHQGPTLAHHAGPVPGHRLVGIETQAHVAAERRVAGGEVVVPRFAPPVALPRGVVGLVGGGQPRGYEIGHPPSLSRYARTLWRLPQTFMEHRYMPHWRS